MYESLNKYPQSARWRCYGWTKQQNETVHIRCLEESAKGFIVWLFDIVCPPQLCLWRLKAAMSQYDTCAPRRQTARNRAWKRNLTDRHRPTTPAARIHRALASGCCSIWRRLQQYSARQRPALPIFVTFVKNAVTESFSGARRQPTARRGHSPRYLPHDISL